LPPRAARIAVPTALARRRHCRDRRRRAATAPAALGKNGASPLVLLLLAKWNLAIMNWLENGSAKPVLHL
jgi:hypothetical protein